MNMQILADALIAAANVLNANTGMAALRETKEVKTVTKRTAKVVETEDEAVESDLDNDMSDETTSVTREEIMLAFKKFTKTFDDVKKGRIEAKKILKKVKAENISEIDESDYEKVLELLDV